MNGAMQETVFIDTKSLADIGLWLEGLKTGRGGNIQPLGNIDLENLWNTIHYLRGDVRYKLKGYKLKEEKKF